MVVAFHRFLMVMFCLFRKCKLCKAEVNLRAGSFFEQFPRVPLAGAVDFFWDFANNHCRKASVITGMTAIL